MLACTGMCELLNKIWQDFPLFLQEDLSMLTRRPAFVPFFHIKIFPQTLSALLGGICSYNCLFAGRKHVLEHCLRVLAQNSHTCLCDMADRCVSFSQHRNTGKIFTNISLQELETFSSSENCLLCCSETGALCVHLNHKYSSS